MRICSAVQNKRKKQDKISSDIIAKHKQNEENRPHFVMKELKVNLKRLHNVAKHFDGDSTVTKDLRVNLKKLDHVSVSVELDDTDEVIFNYSYESFLMIQPNLKKVEDTKPKIEIQNGNEKMENVNAQGSIKMNLIQSGVRRDCDKNLRKLPQKVYVEETILSDTEVEAINRPVKHAVPVYRQILPESKKPILGDEYEFNEFSPDKKSLKRRRLNRSSGFFDKETHEIMKKLEKDASKKRKIQRNVKQGQQKGKGKSYNAKIKKIMANIIQKVQQKQTVSPEHINLYEKSKKTPVQMKHFPAPNVIVTAAEVHTENRDKHSTLGSVHEKSYLPPHKSPNYLFTNTCNENEEDLFEISHNDDYWNISNSNEQHDIQQEVESCFGFEEDEHFQSDKRPKNKVNVISNVIINQRKLVDSPAGFGGGRPNANSTMLPEHFMNQYSNRSNPWRFNVNVTINPHYVSVKKNALPRLDQDVVIDHTLVEEFEASCIKTPTNLSKPRNKSPIQQSLLNYIECSVEKENLPVRGSLFDIDQFTSPIKGFKNTPVERVQGVKRNILGPKVDNIMNTLGSQNSTDNIDRDVTYFGFNDTTTSKVLTKNNEEAAKPSRFDVSMLKKYTSKRKQKLKPVEVLPEPLPDFVEVPNEATESSDNFEVHLFEEPEEILDNMPPEIGKRHKRKRADSVDSDFNEEKKIQKRHRKTKFEIEQEKWIEAFNNEVQETEKFQLETD